MTLAASLKIGAVVIATAAMAYACKARNGSEVKDADSDAAMAAAAGGAPGAAAAAGNAAAIPGTFAYVWSHVQEGPYSVLPEHQTNYASFFEAGVNKLSERAQKTHSERDDIIPTFQKLVHPIGICFAGTWSITKDAYNGQAQKYTGYFANGAKGLIIMRASEAMGNPRFGEGPRAFGLAGKIFPTMDPNDTKLNGRANFFTVDDLGGTNSMSYLDLPKSNEPPISKSFSMMSFAATFAEILKTFALTDKDAGIRQVYEIADLGLIGGPSVSPHWMSLRPESTSRVNGKDFRNELRINNYPEGLNWGIYISEVKDIWTRIGQINLNQESLSEGCDHRLHFHHPLTR